MPSDGTRLFAGYEIVADLGTRDGVHRYKAIQVAIGRPVMLSVLPAEAACKRTYAAAFERQRNVAATLHHENIVSAIDAGEFDGCPYLVTEYVEGTRLSDLLASSGPWEVRFALTMARDVARALTHFEVLGLVHRELCPHTIVMSEEGVARVVDLRHVKHLQSDGAADTWYDTPVVVALYTAPERARGERGADIRADIYSLGCVLYYALTGRPPFYGRNAAVVLDWVRHRRPRDPRWLRPDLPPAVVAVLDGCLRKLPATRYPTAAALCGDLESVLAGGPASTLPAGPCAWERPFDGSA